MGVSQDELAWRAELHRTYIANIERGVCNPSLSTMVKLAGALEISTAALMADAEALQQPATPKPVHSVDILLVESNAADVETTMSSFREFGLSNVVEVVPDTASAKKYLLGAGKKSVRMLAHRPRLIFVSTDLPGPEMRDFLRQLNSDRRTREIPVVVLASADYAGDGSEFKEIGGDELLKKPFAINSLADIAPRLDLSWMLLAPLRRNVA